MTQALSRISNDSQRWRTLIFRSFLWVQIPALRSEKSLRQKISATATRKDSFQRSNQNQSKKKDSRSKTRDISSTVNKTTTTWRAAPTYRSLSCNLLTGQKARDGGVTKRRDPHVKAERSRWKSWGYLENKLRIICHQLKNQPKGKKLLKNGCYTTKISPAVSICVLCQVKLSRKLFLFPTCLRQVWTWWLSRCGFNGVQKGWRGQWIGWWPPSPE